MYENGFSFVFYVEILLMLGGLLFAIHRKKQQTVSTKITAFVCWLTIVVSTIVLIPMFFNSNYWDETLHENGLLGISFLTILYFTFLVAALGFVLFALVLTGDIRELPILHFKAPPKAKTRINVKSYILIEIVRYFGRSILYASLLFLLTVAFLPFIISCDEVISGVCKYFNQIASSIGNVLQNSLNPTPTAFIFLFLGAVIAFIVDRFKQV